MTKGPIIVIHKCEHCGAEYKARKHGPSAIGWCGSGTPSKHGKQYEKSGVAYWCNHPICRREATRRSLSRFYPGASDETLTALVDRTELEKIRQN